MQLNRTTRKILLAVAVVGALGPNGLYLVSVLKDPSLNAQAMANPVAAAFMIEAMMLLVLFLWYVQHRTRSWMQVAGYTVLTFMGSLAFSLPLFLYLDGKENHK